MYLVDLKIFSLFLNAAVDEFRWVIALPGPSGVASAPMMNAYPQQNPGYASQAGYGYSSAQPPAGVSADLWQWFQAVDADRYRTGFFHLPNFASLGSFC